MQPCPCSAWILRSCEWGVAVIVTPHPRGSRHQGPGPSFVHAGPACKTSNFQHNTVSLQGLVGAMISHSTVHPMLLPTWGAGPHPGVVVPSEAQGHTEQSRGRQPPAAVHSCWRVKRTRTSISRSSSRLCRAHSVPEAQKNVGFSSIRTKTKLKPERRGCSQCWELRERAGTRGSLWEPQPGLGTERHPPITRPGPTEYGARARGPVLAPRPVPHQASLLGWGNAGCRLGYGGVVLWAAGNRSCPCHGAALGRGSGCLA